MGRRIVRLRMLRTDTYRPPAPAAWHREYPADWEGPVPVAHFDQLSARGSAVELGRTFPGEPEE